jgi:prolipoprotein diacylglyceryltransferase
LLGFLALLFGALYGTARLVEDFFRVDETHGTGLTGSQWAALTIAALSTWWLLTRRRTPGRKLHAPERVPFESQQGATP